MKIQWYYLIGWVQLKPESIKTQCNRRIGNSLRTGNKRLFNEIRVCTWSTEMLLILQLLLVPMVTAALSTCVRSKSICWRCILVGYIKKIRKKTQTFFSSDLSNTLSILCVHLCVYLFLSVHLSLLLSSELWNHQVSLPYFNFSLPEPFTSPIHVSLVFLPLHALPSLSFHYFYHNSSAAGTHPQCSQSWETHFRCPHLWINSTACHVLKLQWSILCDPSTLLPAPAIPYRQWDLEPPSAPPPPPPPLHPSSGPDFFSN